MEEDQVNLYTKIYIFDEKEEENKIMKINSFYLHLLLWLDIHINTFYILLNPTTKTHA